LCPWKQPAGQCSDRLLLQCICFCQASRASGSAIPSANGVAFTGSLGTYIGHVGRNILRGPAQVNVDFSVSNRFPLTQTKGPEFRAEFFNPFNHVNLANPISNLNAVTASGTLEQASGKIMGNAGDFGRITATSNNPRLVQFGLKLTFWSLRLTLRDPFCLEN